MCSRGRTLEFFTPAAHRRRGRDFAHSPSPPSDLVHTTTRSPSQPNCPLGVCWAAAASQLVWVDANNGAFDVAPLPLAQVLFFDDFRFFVIQILPRRCCF